MSNSEIHNRSRLVLIVPSHDDDDNFAKRLDSALHGGDVASILLPTYDLDAASYRRRSARLCEIAHRHETAIVIENDAEIALETGVDGVHISANPEQVGLMIERFQEKLMIGTGGARLRHQALELGELRPDYILFGRIGYDMKSEPHTRSLDLAEWWASMIEIPCVVLAGSDLVQLERVVRTRAEFVALSRAIFGTGTDPADQVAAANVILDRVGREFEF